MAILKCKMCGGNLSVTDENAVCECEFCGIKQTVPQSASDANVTELFNRANDFRASFNFDKAERIYEQIIESNPSEAEAYWGLILCKFGIEYVKDPRTMNRVPTCHRSSYDPIVTDANYKNALKYANVVQKPIYEAEAKQIDEIQKGILTLARDEEPYDVFICYKETDNTGRRTPDSVLANDIYYQLTNMGYKVFYAAITLEDKLGSAYEPYIFAALNSAKIMLVIGTRPEYFKAVWVKNEWSRYLQIIKKDMKKILVPCYRDMDAYELPEEFSHLQALDMAKIGFINDIERACERVCGKKNQPKAHASAPSSAANGQTANLLRRVYSFLDDGDFDAANEYCEKILDLDFDCTEAYVGKYMVQHKIRTVEELSKNAIDTNDKSYRAVMRGSDERAKAIFNEAIESYCQNIYAEARSLYDNGSYSQAKAEFIKIRTYKDSEDYIKSADISIQRLQEEQERERCQKIYDEAVENYQKAEKLLKFNTFTLNDKERVTEYLKKAGACFQKVVEFKDSILYAKKIGDLTNEYAYLLCVRLLENGELEKVIEVAKSIPNYKDIDDIVLEAKNAVQENNNMKNYIAAKELFDTGEFARALSAFARLGDFRDSQNYVDMCQKEIDIITQNRELMAEKSEKEKQGIKIAKIIACVALILATFAQIIVSNYWRLGEGIGFFLNALSSFISPLIFGIVIGAIVSIILSKKDKKEWAGIGFVSCFCASFYFGIFYGVVVGAIFLILALVKRNAEKIARIVAYIAAGIFALGAVRTAIILNDMLGDFYTLPGFIVGVVLAVIVVACSIAKKRKMLAIDGALACISLSITGSWIMPLAAAIIVLSIVFLTKKQEE